MEKIQKFCESYNMVVEEGYNNAYLSINDGDILKLREDSAEEFIKSGAEKWAGTPVEELDNQTPAEYIDNMTSLNEVMEVFITAAKVCDKDVPRILLDKLKTFGTDAIQELLGLSQDMDKILSDEEFFVPQISVRTLGQWKAETAIAPLISILYRLSETEEIIVEEIVDALINIGEPAAEPLLSAVENAPYIVYTEEYFVTALVKICKNNRNDRVLKCLKDCFNKMEDKILGSMFIGDYGDGRAIPMLRGYLEKNKGKIEKEEYAQIKAVIKHLGGSIQDL